MKCPNCGEEMGSCAPVCEYCGKDIRTMAGFDFEAGEDLDALEMHLPEEIQEDMQEEPEIWEEEYTEAEEHEESVQKSVQRPHFAKRGIVFLMAAAVVVLAIGWMIYTHNSASFQVKRAEWYVAQGKYEEAVECYERALVLDQGNVDLMFSLADVNYLKNNKVEYEYYLREIVRSGKASGELLDGVYQKLIAIYRDREDYQTINTLLLASNNPTLIAAYQTYIVRKPEFSITAGDYTGTQQLKLTTEGAGKIYYTMDGSEPTEDSMQYTAPILLESGDYIVKAFFENERGTSSEVATMEYHIEREEMPAPEINVQSGVYNTPMYIEVEGDNEDVYYTMDGSDPTYSSPVYTGPIPMPLGESYYRFAKIIDNVTGTVAERTYVLELDTDFSPEEAVASVIEYSIANGKIRDAEGHFDRSGSTYQYDFLYVTRINGVDDFYVIAESYRPVGESATRTGNDFAVNVYTRERFKLQQDDRGRFSLIEIEVNENSQEEE